MIHFQSGTAGDGGGTAAAATPAVPVQAAGGGGAAAAPLGDDEKEEGGKRYKKVVKKVKKQRPKAGSGDEITKGAGGTLSKGFERSHTKAKKPKNTTEGQPIDPKSREDNKKALEASTKFKAMKFADAMKKFDSLKPDVEKLQKTTKITDRVQEVEGLAKQITEKNDYERFPPEAIIALANESV